MGTSSTHSPGGNGALSQLRPYRRRLTVLVVLAALGGVAVGELAPSHKPAPKKTAPAGRVGLH